MSLNGKNVNAHAHNSELYWNTQCKAMRNEKKKAIEIGCVLLAMHSANVSMNLLHVCHTYVCSLSLNSQIVYIREVSYYVWSINIFN